MTESGGIGARSTAIGDRGSFRDPHSRVLRDDGRILRVLSTRADEDLAAAQKTAFLATALREGRVVPTRRLAETPEELGIVGPWAAVVEHPMLTTWTYPHEWSFSMLQDAAALQLGLLLAGLDDGIACKDATPYNVQFDGARPVFVDVGSFERYEPGDPWFGYLQFCQLYLYPLLLQAYLDVPFQPWLRGAIDGITPEQAWRALGSRRLHRKGVLVHVALHARAQTTFGGDHGDVKTTMAESGFSKDLIVGNARGLLGLVSGLRWERSESEWSSYSDRGHYADAELVAKERFVSEAAGRRRHAVTWDVGCNDGRFSRLVAPNSDKVLAFDSDHLVVDALYRALRQDRVRDITPAVVDLADPGGGLGWRGRERSPFLERNRPDLVLFLAVIHHLAITGNVPTAHILDLLRDLDAEVVLEIPTEADPMVRQLMANKRSDVHEGYRLDVIEAQVEDRFAVRDRLELDSGTRVLLHLGPR